MAQRQSTYLLGGKPAVGSPNQGGFIAEKHLRHIIGGILEADFIK